MAVFPSERAVVGGYKDGTVRVWDIAKESSDRTIKGHFGPVNSLSISPDRFRIVSAGDDKTLKLWDSVSGEEISAFSGNKSPAKTACFATNDVVLSGASNEVKSWSAVGGNEVWVGRAHNGIVDRVSLSPDSRLLVSAGIDNTCRLFDVATGKQLKILAEFPNYVSSAVFSPDGRSVLVTGHGPLPDGPNDSKLLVGEICLIDLENGSKIWSTRRVFSAAQAIFSRDGKTMVSCSVDGLRIVGC
jgi:WD40 repeat protein